MPKTKKKKCIICNRLFYKKDFPNIFHAMVTCGGDSCKKNYNRIRMVNYRKTHSYKRPELKENDGKPWSIEEIAYLSKNYKKISIGTIIAKLKRNRNSIYQIYYKIKKGLIKKETYTKCIICEKSFLKTTYNKKYCSKKCMEFWYANKDTLKNVIKKRTKICNFCRKTFIAQKLNSKTCSDSCAQRNYFLKNKNEVIKRTNINARRRENKRRKQLGLPLIGEGYRSQNELLAYIKRLFPSEEIITNNFTILGCLQLDIYLPSLKLAFEYQGAQHYVYPNFFHKTKDEFEALQYRDRVKKRLCRFYGIHLLKVNYTEKISETIVMQKLKFLPIKINQRCFNGN